MKSVDAAMRAAYLRGEHSGILSLVARAGEIVHLGAQGELRQDSIVRLASLTKPVVAVGLMTLCEAGELDLDAPLSDWFAEFAELKVMAPDTQSLQPVRRTPTLRQLITHTAGFGYGLFEDSPVEGLYRKAALLGRGGGVGRLQVSLQELPAAVAQLPLAFQPGERWRYSVAHDLAGCLIERITGARLGEFLQARVFGPLGMMDTGFSVPAEKLDRLATMYGPVKDGKLPVLDTPSSSPFLDDAATQSGGGGMVSTLMDYYRFLGMLAGGGALDGVRVLREETVAAMTGNQLVGSQFPMMFGAQRMEGWGYGLGIGVLVGRQANGMLPGTFGWVGITGTSGWVSPRDDTILITLTQSSWNWAAADALHRAVYLPEA